MSSSRQAFRRRRIAQLTLKRGSKQVHLLKSLAPVQVIGATKFGRATAVLGGPASTANAARQIEGVDLLVHPASSDGEDAGCSHAGTAGAAAKQAGAKHLCITGAQMNQRTSPWGLDICRAACLSGDGLCAFHGAVAATGSPLKPMPSVHSFACTCRVSSIKCGHPAHSPGLC